MLMPIPRSSSTYGEFSDVPSWVFEVNVFMSVGLGVLLGRIRLCTYDQQVDHLHLLFPLDNIPETFAAFQFVIYIKLFLN